MQYLIANLWKLPELSRRTTTQLEPDAGEDTLLAAACRDCGQYNFPPKPSCRYCGSPRIRTVSVSSKSGANPGNWVFGAAEAPPKPN